MKDITPQTKKQKNTKRPLLSYVVLLIPVVAVIGLGYGYLIKDTAPADSQPLQEVQSTSETPDIDGASEYITPTALKSFTAAEFVTLYNTFAYPNVAEFETAPPITGDLAADMHIRELAISRGYRGRAVAVPPLTTASDGLLQERAATAWDELVVAARKDGHRLRLTAGFRTIEDQQKLFLTGLRATGASDASIAAKASDAAVVSVLRTTAIPGYTRHHSGYTVDIGCDSDTGKPFGSTACYRWLSQSNYQQAKTYGWIPSYPDGAPNQGPDPEPWEYSWVGSAAVRE